MRFRITPTAIALFALIAIGLLFWFGWREVSRVAHGQLSECLACEGSTSPKEEGGTVIKIKKGTTVSGLAQTLVKAGLIQQKDESISYWILRFILSDTIYSGEYLAKPNQSLLRFANDIKDKRFFYRKFTILEGETSAMIKNKLKDNPHLSGDITESIPEGYLMPETYAFLADTERNTIIVRAKGAMSNYLEGVRPMLEDEGGKPRHYGIKTIRDIITLASVVEKEAANDEEKARVAQVFLNRLKKGMRLQADPTVIYQITNGEFRMRPLSSKDLKSEGGYNTYKISGLPEGPICHPSQKAIEAVLTGLGSSSQLLYFVLKPGGEGHNFSKNLSQHNKYVAQYRRYSRSKAKRTNQQRNPTN